MNDEQKKEYLNECITNKWLSLVVIIVTVFVFWVKKAWRDPIGIFFLGGIILQGIQVFEWYYRHGKRMYFHMLTEDQRGDTSLYLEVESLEFNVRLQVMTLVFIWGYVGLAMLISGYLYQYFWDSIIITLEYGAIIPFAINGGHLIRTYRMSFIITLIIVLVIVGISLAVEPGTFSVAVWAGAIICGVIAVEGKMRL
ncbi:MAG: hypothetical protein ACOX1S_03950 [Anaerostipes sp.]|jgi:hypothetical protein